MVAWLEHEGEDCSETLTWNPYPRNTGELRLGIVSCGACGLIIEFGCRKEELAEIQDRYKKGELPR